MRAKKITIEISNPSFQLLADLARLGVYGRSVEEVAARFVDKELARIHESGSERVR